MTGNKRKDIRMKINKTHSLFLFLIIFFCAAYAEAEIVKGEKFAGEEITYAYKLETKEGQYFLVKQPICWEMQEEMEIYKEKKKRAIEAAAVVATPMIIATPYVGSFVLQKAWVASEGKNKKHHDDIQTGRILLCGEQEPGPGEKLIIQTSGMKIIKDIVTESNGAIDLKGIAKKAGDEIYLNIFIKKEDSVFYLSTIYL
jgi:hypothetical protein